MPQLYLKEAGFHLIECIIACLILGIIWMGSSHVYYRWLDTIQIQAVQERLIHIIQYARTMAYTRKIRLQIVPLEPQHWESGVALQDGAGHVLYTWPQVGNIHMHIEWHGVKSILSIPCDIKKSIVNGYFIIETPYHHARVTCNRLGVTHAKIY